MAPLIFLAAFLLLAPESAEELYRRGLLLLRSNDAKEAVAALESAAKLQPSHPLIWMAIADARLRLSLPKEALQAEAQATRVAGSDPVVRKVRGMFHARYAEFLLNRKAEKAAETASRSALKQFPQSPELHRLLGLSLYAQGRNSEALDAFLGAIDLAPNNELYYSSLETLLPDAGPKLPAISRRLHRLAKANPKSPLAPYLQALCTPDKNTELLRQAIELDPDFWPAYFELQKRLPSPEEKVPLLEKVVALNPTYAPAYYALGSAYASLGNRDAARQAREKHHALTNQ